MLRPIIASPAELQNNSIKKPAFIKGVVVPFTVTPVKVAPVVQVSDAGSDIFLI